MKPGGILAAAAGLLLVPGLWVAFGGCTRMDPSYERMRIGAHEITVEVASTRATRARGLMYRSELPPDHGMLFIYPAEREMSFWMRNTQIPLDIAYIGADGVIHEVHYMKPYDESSVVSERHARYALEMNFGWFDAHKVGAGDRLEMPESVRAVVGEQ